MRRLVRLAHYAAVAAGAAVVCAPHLACAPQVGAAAQPQSPAEAAGNAAATSAPASDRDCPPRCTSDGTWIGCGLAKPRGGDCVGCTPRCRLKGNVDEGWYDCAGILIVKTKCG